MQASQYTAESFWQLYQSLSDETKIAVLKKFSRETNFFEDVLDEVTFDERVEEPSVSLEDYLKKRANRQPA
jgi:hypothetical protein